MSFGKSPDDYRELAGAAHATLINARKACGDGDALTLSISSLHHTLSRLSTGVELSEREGGVRKREGDNRWHELATLARDCARLLKVLNQVLGKYNSLPNEKKKVTKLWRRVKFGNGDILDLEKIQGEMGAYTQAISLFLGSVERGEVGEVEGYMDTHGAELREVKHTFHWVIAKMLALDDGQEEGVLRNWRDGLDGGILLNVIKDQLANEGWDLKVLARHQKTIARYVVELGERGVLDATEVELKSGQTPIGADLRLDRNKSVDRSVRDSESESDSGSSVDEGDGAQMPLGRRPSETVPKEQKPVIHTSIPSRKRSLDEVQSSEDDSEDEPSLGGQPDSSVPKTYTQHLKPLQIHTAHVLELEQSNNDAIKKVGIRPEGSPVSDVHSMALSISSLPPLPVSRPRSRNSDNDVVDDSGQSFLSEMHPGHLALPDSTIGSVVQAGHTSVELFSSQTLSISSLPPLPISRPRSQNSLHNTLMNSTQLLSDQKQPLHKTSESLTYVDRGSDTSSGESSESEEDLGHFSKDRDEVLDTSSLPMSLGRHSANRVQEHADKAKIKSPQTTQGLVARESPNRHTIKPPTRSLEMLPTPLPLASPARRQTNKLRGSDDSQPSEKGDNLTKSDTSVRPSMAAPIKSAKHLHGKGPPSFRTDLVNTLDSSNPNHYEIKTKSSDEFQAKSLQPDNASTLRVINSESSIARPRSQIQRKMKSSSTNVVFMAKGGTDVLASRQLIVDAEGHLSKSEQITQSQLNIRPESPALSAKSAPSLTKISRLAEFHLDDSSSDESEQSYLIINDASGSQASYDEGLDSNHAVAIQTGSMENIVAESSFDPLSPANTKKTDLATGNGISEAVSSDIDGQSYMNAWSVILSHVSDDHESSLLETSGIWAQSNSAIHSASTKALSHHEEPDKDNAGLVTVYERQEEPRSRSRNMTLVGDSDDEPRPPASTELWPKGAPINPRSVNTSALNLAGEGIVDELHYDSGTDESVTIPGDSDDEPFSPMKPVAILDSVVLPVTAHEPKRKDVLHNHTVDSDYESSTDGVTEEEEFPRGVAKSPIYDVQYSRTLPEIQLLIKADTPVEPIHFREMDYQPEKRTMQHIDLNTSEISRGRDKTQSLRGKESRNERIESTANLTHETRRKEVNHRAQEYQVPTEAAKGVGAISNTPSLSGSSALPLFRQITSFGSSTRSWWWSANKAARAQYQPTVEEINDEDSLPGAHPNCWLNDSDEFSQAGNDLKDVPDLSRSARKEPKSHVAQYLNPFREKSILKSYKISTGDSHSSSDDEAPSLQFPSEDETEDIRKYRSGKQIVYEDPDLSFNSALDESSDFEDGFQNGPQKKKAAATIEQREAFKKGIKADRYSKKRYRLEKGKEAVWGSASEREERRKVRSLGKKTADLPKILGGKKTVTFEVQSQLEAGSNAQRPERPDAKLKEMCRAFIEDVRDEDFLPGAHPNCEAASGSSETSDVLTHSNLESAPSVPLPGLKVRTTNESVSPSKSAPASRQAKGKRLRNTVQIPLSDDDKDEDLLRYRREETAQPPQEDAAPSWRSTRAYRSKKSKQRRFSHGEDEKFWDEPTSWGGEAAGSSEDDWGEAYRSDNSRNSSVVAIGGCTCCVSEAQPKRRRQHYRSPPVIHHPDLNPVNPFLPTEKITVAPIQQQQSRRRSSIDPWSPDPPSVRRHRREKASESPTYHVPDAPAPLLNSARPELPVRRRTDNVESSPQAPRPDLARRRTDIVESTPQTVRPETGRRTIRTAVREHSPTNIRPEQPKRRAENGEDSLQAARPDIGRRLSIRKQSPTRPDIPRRRTDAIESVPLSARPEMSRRRTVDRELSPAEARPEIPRRMTVDKEHKPREKLLRFDIK